MNINIEIDNQKRIIRRLDTIIQQLKAQNAYLEYLSLTLPTEYPEDRYNLQMRLKEIINRTPGADR